MFPWIVNWSPDLRFPFSGSVKQDIAPETVFGAIEPSAGIPQVEREVFTSVAAYGKQLGILSEVVLALADPASVSAEDAKCALEQLKTIRAQVEAVKRDHLQDRRRNAEAALAALAASDPNGLEAVLAKYRQNG